MNPIAQILLMKVLPIAAIAGGGLFAVKKLNPFGKIKDFFAKSKERREARKATRVAKKTVRLQARAAKKTARLQARNERKAKRSRFLTNIFSKRGRSRARA
ncbi:MAG: hypothetical protein ACTSWW_13505 [Promethearchaeota archaeon]